MYVCMYVLLLAVPTVRPVAAVGAPSVVYYSLGGVIAIVVLAVIIVFLLGVVAYRRCVLVPCMHKFMYVFSFML